MKQLRIALCGASGRMGRQIAALGAHDNRITINSAFSKGYRKQALTTFLKLADVLLDFTLPKASLGFVQAAAKARIPAVVGTTGFSPAQLKKLRSYAKRIPLFLAPNMSPGMNLLFELAHKASSALADYDITITETHHTSKVDAPSGSAKRLREAVENGRKRKSRIETVSIRAGNIIGDHTLLLAGPDERIELTHRAQSRDVFARGAINAALWVAKKRPGIYTMRDLLKL